MSDAPTDDSTAAMSVDRLAGYSVCIADTLMAATMAEPSDIDSDTDSDFLTAEYLVDLSADDLAGQMVVNLACILALTMVANLDGFGVERKAAWMVDEMAAMMVDMMDSVVVPVWVDKMGLN
jgi:hypothetical protein